MQTFGDREPEIDYPTTWGYRLIGESEADLRAAVSAVLGELEHVLAFSHLSSGGRYCSMALDLVVYSREQRRAIFKGLSEHPGVRMVI